MSMGAKTLLSLEQFMALPDDGNQYELNQGELVVMPPAARTHVFIIRLINLILSQFVNGRRIGQIYTEAGYLLFREPEATYRQPDVSFLSNERLRAMPEGTLLEGAPDLAVEVVSPGDDAADLDVKVRQYLANGSQEVWVFYPKTRSVQVHKPGGQVLKLADSDILTTDLFPGWSCRVADFFDLDC